MNKSTTLEERNEIMVLSQAGWSDKKIGQHLERSESVVRKWRRRGQREGRSGLRSKMGRPRQGALSSYPAKVREAVHHWRKQHPGWGAQTLYAELVDHPEFAGQKMPSPASIARYLKAQGLTRPYERHSRLPQPLEQVAARPHMMWEMDARGYSPVPDAGIIALINLNDRFSHLRLLSYPCQVGYRRWRRHPNTEDYQVALRLAFTDWGLPEQLQVDHGSVFIDNSSKSPFPTRLHLWLLALGVSLTFGRPHQPRDQGMTERSHQLWAAQCLTGQRYASWDHLYLTLRQRRDFLNYQLPCAPLNHQPPLKAFPHAIHSQRPYRPEWEADLLDLSRIDAYLAQGCWFRLVGKDGTFSLGNRVYYLGKAWARQALEITFDPHDQQLLCCDDAGQLIKRFPVQGINPDTLMGLLASHINLPFFQLALPFDHEPFQVSRLFDTMGSRLNET